MTITEGDMIHILTEENMIQEGLIPIIEIMEKATDTEILHLGNMINIIEILMSIDIMTDDL